MNRQFIIWNQYLCCGVDTTGTMTLSSLLIIVDQVIDYSSADFLFSDCAAFYQYFVGIRQTEFYLWLLK